MSGGKAGDAADYDAVVAAAAGRAGRVRPTTSWEGEGRSARFSAFLHRRTTTEMARKSSPVFVTLGATSACIRLPFGLTSRL